MGEIGVQPAGKQVSDKRELGSLPEEPRAVTVLASSLCLHIPGAKGQEVWEEPWEERGGACVWCGVGGGM